MACSARFRTLTQDFVTRDDENNTDVAQRVCCSIGMFVIRIVSSGCKYDIRVAVRFRWLPTIHSVVDCLRNIRVPFGGNSVTAAVFVIRRSGWNRTVPSYVVVNVNVIVAAAINFG